MNCYEFQDIISSYIDREFPLAKVKQFDRHYENCPACHDVYERTVSVVNALANSDRIGVSRGFNKRLQARIGRISSRRPNRFGRYFSQGRILGFEPKYAVASVVAVVLIVVLSVGLFPEREGVASVTPIPLSTRQEVPDPAAVPGERNQPLESSTPYLADETKDDSTEAGQKVTKSVRDYQGKIKLVKDRQ